MLETHPQKAQLNIVLLPLAKEVIWGYENIPLPVKELAEKCNELKESFGFKSFDLS